MASAQKSTVRRIEKAYENYTTALPGAVVVRPGARCFHIPRFTAEEPDVACTAIGHTGDFQMVSREVALGAGYSACRKCFRDLLEFLATQEESDVVRVDSRPEHDHADLHDYDHGEVELATGTRTVRPPLEALTEEVRVTKHKMHAPAGDGGILCGADYDTRLVSLEAIRGFRDPCGSCFNLSALDDE